MNNELFTRFVGGSKDLQRVMLRLIQDGFEPLCGEIGIHQRPYIAVRYSRHCETLKQQYHAAESQPPSRLPARHWECVIDGVIVSWMEAKQ